MNRSKKHVIAIIAMFIVFAVAFHALAAWGTMYVNRAKANVYAEDNMDSNVIKTYKGGKEITVDAVSPDGNWAQITVGDGLGFMRMEDLSMEFPQSFCEHEWGKWTVEREPSCTQKGYRYRFCKICNLRDEDEPKKLKHEFGKWKVIEEATCVEEGERVRTCKNCGYEETETFLADHEFGAWKITKEATCTQKGERVRTCQVCGQQQKQALDKLPHDYAYTVVTEPTDHSAGVRVKICRVCGHDGGEESFDPEGTLRRKARGEEVRALQQLLVDQGYLKASGADGVYGGGTEKAVMQFQRDQGLTPDGIAWPQTRQRLNHDFGPWQVVRHTTRTEAGERVRVCKDCGYEQYETVEPGIAFERGRRGEDIRALQKILNGMGFDAGKADGVYGKKLDRAMAEFAAANGLTVESGRILPADVDAAVNAWLLAMPDDAWMGETGADSPILLDLTVAPVGGADDSGMSTYRWTLRNQGSEEAAFTALLLCFGDTPDFRRNSLVMTLDNIGMKPGDRDAAAGYFTVDEAWGTGSLNFAALAVSPKTDAKWLSNTVSIENAAQSVSEPAA